MVSRCCNVDAWFYQNSECAFYVCDGCYRACDMIYLSYEERNSYDTGNYYQTKENIRQL